ncbi:hypothetical protein ACFLT5_00575 [Chloroflexota bacterium]
MAIRAILAVMEYGPRGHSRRATGQLDIFDGPEENMVWFLQPRDGLYDRIAGVENQTLSPGLEFGLELGGPIQVG